MRYSNNFDIEIKKLNYLFDNMSNGIVASFSIVTLVFFTIKGYVDTPTLYIWFALNFILLILKVMLFKSYKKNIITFDNFYAYYIIFFIIMIVSSCLWGIIAFVLLPQEIELQILMLLLVGGVATGATITLASKINILRTYILLSLLPFLFVFYYQDSNISHSIILGTSFYIIFLLIVSKKISLNIISNIILEYKNKDLIYKLEQKVDEANQANQAKSRFLSVMSHEIRTPLNAIVGFVKILKKSEVDPTKQQQLEIINKSSNLLMSVINDILDVSKIESGKFSIESVKFEPYKELHYLYNLYNKICDEKGVRLINSISTELPKYIKSDPLRLKQIISNLLSNAIKFTPKGNNIELICTFNKEKSSLFIEVKDTGIGIRDENIVKITENFTQADNTIARRYGGTGLGLFIVTKLLTLLKSELKIKSELGVGSCFYFELPVELAEHIENDEEKEIKFDFKGKKILVAEDNKTNQILIEFLLENMNIEVTIANDGVEAENIFKEKSFDLILMDINMPNKNGYEAMKSIKKYEKNIPIIALTANAVSGDRKKYIESGFDDYIPKPIVNDELTKAFSKYLL